MSSPDAPRDTAADVVAKRRYLQIVEAVEADLAEHGDTYLGVGWTKSPEHADRRYRVALDVVRREPGASVSLLDFGCGASHLYEYMLRHGVTGIEYAGLDLSPAFLELSRAKHPDVTYYDIDVLADASRLPEFDYVVMNGIFNYKGELGYDAMLEYARTLLVCLFDKARQGLCFNAMSTLVDWQRDDLFHLPFDVIAPFLAERLSRHIVFRHDYGLYEYMTYVYRTPPGDSR